MKTAIISLSVVALVFMAGCPSSRKGPRTKAQTKTDPKGGQRVLNKSSKYLTGPILVGMIWNGDGLKPLSGAQVSEYGVDSPDSATTDSKGNYKLKIKNEDAPAILVKKPGFIDTIQICSRASRPVFEGQVIIEIFARELEKLAAKEFPGGPPSPEQGRVLLNFQPQGVPGGVSAKLESSGAKAWIHDQKDRIQSGNKISDTPKYGEIIFTDVQQGWTAVEVSTPEGTSCVGPKKVPVVSGTYTRVYYLCKKK